MAEEVIHTVIGVLFRSIQERISSIYQFKRNVRHLKELAEDLRLQKHSVMADVEDAQRQGDKISDVVEGWLDKVDEFIERLERITTEDEVDETEKRRFKGLSRPNLMTRYVRSRKVGKLVEECRLLLGDGYFARVARRNPPQRTRSKYFKDDYAFDSRESVFQDVMETLKNTDVKAIGIHGMGGVGKTTLVKKVCWQAIKDRLFDQVVMAEVTPNPDLKKIQQEIAEQLGLEFREETLDARASRLHERLKKEKNVLVVLDDVWRELDLDAIGIPLTSADHRHCSKILLTSRDLRVCIAMKTQKNISLAPLYSEEALDLFWRILDDPEGKIEFEHIAAEIVEKCGGLPLAIVTIAKTMKDKGQSVWNQVLIQLKGSHSDQNILSVIELSYNSIEREAKSLFLLCSLHQVGRPILVDHLVSYVMGLGLFQCVKTLVDVRERVHQLIEVLKDSFLLDGDEKISVKMHDVIHVVAQRIASRDELMFNFQDVADLKEELENHVYKEAKAISLPYMNVRELPEVPELPQLKMLLLLMEEERLKIPNHFFDRMEELEVLNLTGVDLSSLSPSLGHLTNLQTLHLEYCHLGDITTVGKLDKLKALSFFSSDIEKLPEEIGELTELKFLNLQKCLLLKEIPPNVLSKLTSLEELYMGDSFVGWDVRGWKNASLNELKQLDCLTCLNIHVLDNEIVPHDLFLEKLERYSIFIGDMWDWSDECESSRVLKLKFSDSNFLTHGVKMLMTNADELYLDELNGISSVYPELSAEGFRNLKHLNVQGGRHVLHIMEELLDPYNAFPMLESLVLVNLINLREICHRQMQAESFSKLKIISVENCDALTHLISFPMVETFSALQEIKVADCKNLEEIIGKKNEEDIQIRNIEFTRLLSLTLKYLPKFTNFGPASCMGTHEIITEEDYEDVMSIFKEVFFPKLENLYLTSLNIESIWSDQGPETCSFGRTLTSLVVRKCSGMRFLFSSSVVKNLPQLQNLKIGGCESMEVIISKEGSGEENYIARICFPKLTYLELEGLWKLTRFADETVEFLSLERLWIENCPNLKAFMSSAMSLYRMTSSKEPQMTSKVGSVDALFNEKVVLYFLKELELSSIDCEKIWQDQLVEESTRILTLTTSVSDGFTGLSGLLSSSNYLASPPRYQEISGLKNLRLLKVNDCSRLKYLFAHSVVSQLANLKELEIKNCAKMQEIITKDGETDAATDTTIFPELHRLHLEDIPELERFCSFTENIVELSAVSLPKLTSLQLRMLPKLESFYPGLHNSVWPLLKELVVDKCDNVEIFASEFQIVHGENLIAQPLFIVDEEAFPRLEQLKLVSNDILKEMWHGEKPSRIFQNVRSLQVSDCDSLKYFMPSSVPFRCLTAMEISECNGSMSLLTYVMATSLHQLTRMDISNCERIEEIITRPGDEVTSQIVFDQLEYLRLDCLPSLAGFYLGNHMLEFPSLETVIVEQCPNMKIFSEGVLSTPKLKGVQFTATEDEWYWEGDLNSTIQTMVSNAAVEELKLSNLPELVQLWNEPSRALQNLTILEISECDRLMSLMTFSTAKNLKQLTRIDIAGCKMIVEIIVHMGDEGTDSVVFKQLKYLGLNCLPNITGFYLGDNTIEFPALEHLVVRQCPKMNSFSLGVLRTPNLKRVKFTESVDEWHCERDLNTTIQQLYNKRNIQNEDRVSLSENKC